MFSAYSFECGELILRLSLAAIAFSEADVVQHVPVSVCHLLVMAFALFMLVQYKIEDALRSITCWEAKVPRGASATFTSLPCP